MPTYDIKYAPKVEILLSTNYSHLFGGFIGKTAHSDRRFRLISSKNGDFTPGFIIIDPL